MFLPESASPLIIDSNAVLGPVYLPPKYPSGGIPAIRRLPPPRPVAKHASLLPKESIDSGTHSEDRTTNVNFGVEELVDFCGPGRPHLTRLAAISQLSSTSPLVYTEFIDVR